MAEKIKTLDIPVDGMHCSSCSLVVEKSLNKLDAVESTDVDLNTNKAHITLKGDLDPDLIDKTVESVGFTVPKEEAVIQIAGMHCASCVNNVEKFVPRVDGIIGANANLSNQKVTLTYYRDMLDLKEVKKTIEMLGFEYIGLDKDVDILDEEARYEKDLQSKLYRIIVGLIFSAILMIMMWYEIMIPPLDMCQSSLVVAILPFIYVSYPILKAGFNSFRHGNLDMDVMYSMGILVAFISSLLGTFNIILDSSFMFYDSAVMLPSFLTIGRYLEARAKRQTSSSIRELIGLQPKTATLVTTDEDGREIEKEIDIEDIQIGDKLLVKPGEKIPADAAVIGGESYVDEAMITGEPVPKLKKDGSDVFAGTINQDSVLKVEAQKIGSETVLSQIIELVEKAQGSKPPVQRLANKAVTWFIPTILTIAIVASLLWYFVFKPGDLLFALTCLISILVVACPCALGLATPTAVTVGVGRAAEYGILIKNGETLESSKDVDTVVFDKTGTITEGKPEVADIVCFDYDDDKFLQILSTVENNSHHPISKAILNKFKSNNIDLLEAGGEDLSLLECNEFENITGKGLKANVVIDGESQEVLAGNLKLLEDEDVAVSDEVLEKFNSFVGESKTTICMSIGGKVAGILTLMDKLKPSSKKAINALHEMGIETYMLTGDNEKTAESVAKSVGIDNVMANVLPNDKLDKVKELQNSGKRVLFVGDGINDAPALSQADIGVAMGNGTDIAMESGDTVIMEGDLENVVASIQISNKVMTRIKENLFWAFAYNMLLVPAAAGILTPLFGIYFQPEWGGLAMALSSVTVISLSLLLKGYVPPIKKESKT